MAEYRINEILLICPTCLRPHSMGWRSLVSDILSNGPTEKSYPLVSQPHQLNYSWNFMAEELLLKYFYISHHGSICGVMLVVSLDDCWCWWQDRQEENLNEICETHLSTSKLWIKLFSCCLSCSFVPNYVQR